MNDNAPITSNSNKPEELKDCVVLEDREARLTYYRSLPAKRMASGVLFFDNQERILVVKPIYRQDWLIPGGVVEEGESPRDACVREVREELGLDVKIGQLLCVDYTQTEQDKTESLQFIFYGGILTTGDIERCVLQEEELSEYNFLSLDEALPLLNAKLARRLPHCLQALQRGTTSYLEDGQCPT